MKKQQISTIQDPGWYICHIVRVSELTNCHSTSLYALSLLTCVSGTEFLDRQVRSVGDVSLVNAPHVVVHVTVAALSWSAA